MGAEKKQRVLIVDDEEVVRDFLQRFFVLKGLEVATAENGPLAIEAVRKEPFDIVFLDIRMPQMNGLEALRELKKISPRTKFYMMTGYAVDDMLREAEREGAVASIKKPFDINQLSVLLEGLSLQSAPRKEISILVVDDEDVVLQFFKRLLHEFSVTCVPSGREALERLKVQEFDLVFLDIVLEDANGLLLSKKIKEVRPKAEIILITGDPLREDETKSLGIRGCFWKPFEIDKILNEVELAKKRKGAKS